MADNGSGNGQTSGRRKADKPGWFDKKVKKAVESAPGGKGDCLLPVIRMFLLLAYFALWFFSIRHRFNGS